jgi:chaperonin cofactor prefoldin
MGLSFIARPAIVAWFIVLFFVSLSVAIVTLSASQLQDRLIGLSDSDVPISVWQIERIRKQGALQTAQVSLLTQELSAATVTYRQASTDLDEIQPKLVQADLDFRRSTEDIISNLSLYVPLEFTGDEVAHAVETRRKIERLVGNLKRGGDLEPSSQARLDELYAGYRASITRLDELEPNAVDLSRRVETARKAMEDAREKLKLADGEMDRMVGDNAALRGANPVEIFDLIEEFSFIEGFAGGTLYKFSVLPNEFLVMILVIAMGTLGATLQLTYDYYRLNTIPRPSHFLLRPMLGAITAIVLFIFLRAGVIVVTDSTKLNEAPPLSPFFIAFVGIVAGFLSENAMETVTRIGQSWLRGSDRATRIERWGIDLGRHLVAPRTLEQFASATGTELQTVRQWFNGETAIPPEAQKLIAVWLGMEPHLLFTDLQPTSPSGP